MHKIRASSQSDQAPASNSGAGLKAAWYGAEAFGKLFGRGNDRASAEQAEASTSGRPAISWDELKAGIRADYDDNYFVSGCADMSVYDPNCEFSDPFVSFKGVDRFKQNLANFGNLTCASANACTSAQRRVCVLACCSMSQPLSREIVEHTRLQKFKV